MRDIRRMLRGPLPFSLLIPAGDQIDFVQWHKHFARDQIFSLPHSVHFVYKRFGGNTTYFVGTGSHPDELKEEFLVRRGSQDDDAHRRILLVQRACEFEGIRRGKAGIKDRHLRVMLHYQPYDFGMINGFENQAPIETLKHCPYPRSKERHTLHKNYSYHSGPPKAADISWLTAVRGAGGASRQRANISHAQPRRNQRHREQSADDKDRCRSNDVG